MIGTLEPVIELSGTLSGVPTLSGTLSGMMELSGTLSSQFSHSTYDGDYTITPSEQTQILNTKDLLSSSNFTINPIPSNYGLITYDGTSIRVS